MRASHKFSAEFDDDNLIAGADSISDMDLIRHGGMERAFTKHRGGQEE